MESFLPSPPSLPLRSAPQKADRRQTGRRLRQKRLGNNALCVNMYLPSSLPLLHSPEATRPPNRVD